jgi:hypothetical protein
MNRLTLALALVMSTAALAAPPLVTRTGDHALTWHAETLNRFDVLDIAPDKGLAAVKMIESQMGDMEHSAYDCAYPGMKEFPTSGVKLALWDLKAHKIVQEWVVYAPAIEASGCSSAATNESNLAAAKAKFASVGLDIAKKPAPVQAANGTYTLTVADKAVTVKATADGGNAALSLNGAPFYKTTWDASEGAFGSAQFEFGPAYVVGTKVVFVEKNWFQTMRSSDNWLALSPAFDLGS